MSASLGLVLLALVTDLEAHAPLSLAVGLIVEELGIGALTGIGQFSRFSHWFDG